MQEMPQMKEHQIMRRSSASLRLLKFKTSLSLISNSWVWRRLRWNWAASSAGLQGMIQLCLVGFCPPKMLTSDLRFHLSVSPFLVVLWWNTICDAVTTTKASRSVLVLKGHLNLFKVRFSALWGDIQPNWRTWLSELCPKVKKDNG